MTLAEIRTEAQTRAQDTSFSTTFIDQWVNLAIKQIAARGDWPWNIATKTTDTTTSGTTEYALPTDFKKMISVRVGTSASSADDTEASEYSFLQYTNKNIVATAPSTVVGAWYYLNPANSTYGLLPEPTTSSLPIYLKYYKIPATISTASETPPFPENYHEAVVQFALQRYWEANDDYGKARFHNAEFENLVDQMKTDLLVRATGQLPRVRDIREFVGVESPQQLNQVELGR